MKIESSTKGHEELELPVEEAIARVKSETSGNGKWLYCDGKYISAGFVTEEETARLRHTLSQARDVTLAGTLLGG
jgi:hypothetical protein